MKYLFILPGSPAPIGGFKLLYEHGRILLNAGHDVTFLHINGGLVSQIKRKSFLPRLVSIVNFFWINNFGKWKNYANNEFGINSLCKQKILQSDINNFEVLVIASWQLMLELYDHLDLSHLKVIHPVMDYPDFMGPAEKIKSSWKKPASYFCISNYLYQSVILHNDSKAIINLGCILPGNDTLYNQSHIDQEVSRSGILLSYSSGKYKNPQGTCKLISEIRLKFPDTKITVFGRPKPPEGLPSDVNYLQNLSDGEVSALYRSSKVFVFFSNFEGFGLMPLEAMQQGCAVVCTDCFGNRDYIKHNENSFVVQPGDIKGALEGISEILQNSELQERLVNGGLKASHDFKPDKFKESIIEAYENV